MIVITPRHGIRILANALSTAHSMFHRIIMWFAVIAGSMSATATAADDLGAGWKLASSIPAAEARQAVAADGQYVYVMDNRTVALYDCTTGQRMEQSG